jgi:hypothetical protein
MKHTLSLCAINYDAVYSNNPVFLQGGVIVPESGGNADVPSICVAPDGSLAVNYTAANGSNITRMYVAGRAATDPAGIMRAPRSVMSGPTTDGRWGDYSSCVVDINSSGVAQNSFWACNEYLTSPGQFNWRTRLVNFTIDAVPPIPTGPAATAGGNHVILAWNASVGATSYNVKRSNTSGGPYITVGSASGATYNDAGLTNGVTYYYVISAFNAFGESGNSVQVSATPSVAASLKTWYAADSIVGVPNGGAIATWTDQSGNNNTATQASAGLRPIYATNALNGLPVVQFTSGSSNYLGFTRPIQDDFTIFCVFRSSQGLGSGNLFYQGAGLVNGEMPGVVNDLGTCLFANGQICAGTGNPDVAVNSTTGFNDGKAHLISFKRTRSTGVVSLYVDAGLAGTTTGGTNSLTAPAQLVLGAQQTLINFLTGDIAEVKVYDSALADSDRMAQESALMQKWGIGLPATPAGLAANPGITQMSLSWNTSVLASGYKLKRSTTNGGPYAVIAGGPGRTYSDTAVVNGLSYYYVISATNSIGESGNSAQVIATMPRVTLTVGGYTNGQFTLQFQAANGQNFVVEVSTNLLNWVPVATNTPIGGVLSYTDTNAIAPAQFYRVRN